MKIFRKLFLLSGIALLATGCASTPYLGKEVSNEEFFRAAENMMIGMATHYKGEVYAYMETNLGKVEHTYKIDKGIEEVPFSPEESAALQVNEAYSFVNVRAKLLTYKVTYRTFLDTEKLQYALTVDLVGRSIDQGGTQDYIATYIWEAHGLVTYVEETIRTVGQTMRSTEYVKSTFSYNF